MEQFPIDIGAKVNDLPFTSGGVLTALDLTTTSASVSLTTGAYVVYNAGSVLVGARIGGTASIPASGSSVVGGFVIPAGMVAGFTIDSDGEALHALTASSTATLYLVRVTR